MFTENIQHEAKQSPEAGVGRKNGRQDHCYKGTAAAIAAEGHQCSTAEPCLVVGMKNALGDAVAGDQNGLLLPPQLQTRKTISVN